MEGGTAQALDFVLEYIGLNNLIKDRETLLNTRLVSRAFRASTVFSSQIKAVTLHTVDDVKMATVLLPSTLKCRQLWRGVGDSCIFPNLTTLCIPAYLLVQLMECEPCVKLLAEVWEVEGRTFDLCVDAANVKQTVAFSTLSNLGYSFNLKWAGDLDLLFNNAAALACLTRLRICDKPNCDIPALMTTIALLSSLRHLELSDLVALDIFRGDIGFSEFCAALTQLTRLEFLKGYCSFNVAPGLLGDYKSSFFSEGPIQFEWCGISALFSNGSYRLERIEGSVKVYRPQESDTTKAMLFSKLLKYGECSQYLKISLGTDCEKGVIKPVICLNFGKHHGAQVFCIDFDNGAQQATEREPHQSNVNQRYCNLATDCVGPVSINQQGAQVAAVRIKLNLWVFDITELVNIVQQLPTSFPQLEHVELYSSSPIGCSTFLESFCQLTKLTHLHLTFYDRAYASPAGPLPCLPPSLRELDVGAFDFALLPLSNPELLTKLTLIGSGSTNWKTVLSYHYPNLETLSLNFISCNYNLSALGEAFPLLKTLEIKLDCPDISPLSTLRYLQNLKIIFPYSSESANVVGATSLTTLASLCVEDADESLEGLRNLVSLVNLRYLAYFIDIRTYRSFVPSEESVAKDCRALKEELSARMPQTRIQIRVGKTEV